MKPIATSIRVPTSWLRDWLSLVVGESKADRTGANRFVRIEEWACRKEERVIGAAVVSSALFVTLVLATQLGPLKVAEESSASAKAGGELSMVVLVLLACVSLALICAIPIGALCRRKVSIRVLTFVFLASFGPPLPLIAAGNFLLHMKRAPFSLFGFALLLIGLGLGPIRAACAVDRYLQTLPCPKHEKYDLCPRPCRFGLRATYWLLAGTALLTVAAALFGYV